MFKSMKCIKTGCTVECSGIISHGDLMYYNGIVILSGVPKDCFIPRSEHKPHLKTEHRIDIPGCGDRDCFILEGKFETRKDLLEQFKEWEKPEVVELFSKNVFEK